VRARVGDRTRIVEVVRVIHKRVGAADAATCFIDRTPAPAADETGTPRAGQVAFGPAVKPGGS